MQKGLGKMPNPFTFRKTIKSDPKNFDDPESFFLSHNALLINF